MDIFLRAIAILIEVVILAGIMYALLRGVKVIAFDLGLGEKYKKFITMALIAVGSIAVIFFIAHLTSFYPSL